MGLAHSSTSCPSTEDHCETHQVEDSGKDGRTTFISDSKEGEEGGHMTETKASQAPDAFSLRFVLRRVPKCSQTFFGPPTPK